MGYAEIYAKVIHATNREEKISNIEVSLFSKESKISLYVYMKEYVIFKTIALCLNRFTMFHTNWLNILFSWRYNN